MLITARWLLTGATPPLKDGALRAEGDTIREVGTRKWFAKKDAGDVIDLGETILIPGLVNAHCHLDHSSLKSPQPPFAKGGQGGISFSAWVRSLQQQSTEEKRAGIPDRIQELIRGGTTTLMDHRSPESGFFETPFRETVIWEVLGAGKDKAEASLVAARRRLEESDDGRPGHVSPHSLYAVHPNILAELVSPPLPPLKVRGGTEGGVMSIHLLESEEEDRFFRHGDGPLADLVRERGGIVPFPETSPVRWLRHKGSLQEGLLIVHGNYLSGEEIQLLRGSGASVIHCPGSHRFFGHRPFPLEELVRAAIPVALGTDSLASNDSLNMLREMRRMKEEFPGWGEEEILQMATRSGARAVGWDHEIGTLEVGKKADLVGVPLLRNDLDPYEALLLAEEANFVMVEGRILTSPQSPLLNKERGVRGEV